MKDYVDRIVNTNDLDQESGSTFTRVTFNKTDKGADIELKNFSFCCFTDCIYNAIFKQCNFVGAEGDVPPAEKCSESNLHTGVGQWGSRADFLAGRLVKSDKTLRVQPNVPGIEEMKKIIEQMKKVNEARRK